MLGAIAGDIIGSRFEWNNIKTTDFELFTKKSKFTDDTVLTVAVADSILNKKPFAENLKKYTKKYPYRGYGGHFKQWARGDKVNSPYGSWGNGSAMRVSAIGFYCNDLDRVLKGAKISAEATHNHPEGIKGAQAIATAIFIAKTYKSKKAVKDYVQETFEYDLDRILDEIRPTYKFDVSCQGSCPQAIIAFLESKDFEDAIRKAISIGGDSDTIACMTGGIAQAFYGGVPLYIKEKVYEILDVDLIEVIEQFESEYMQ